MVFGTIRYSNLYQGENLLNNRSWIIFAAATLGLLTALVLYSGGSRLDVSKINQNLIQTANSQNGNIGDHVSGKIDSPVTLIEYGDYQCPACGKYYPQIKLVTDEYKDQLQFVFRNFPITTAHANAKAAAGAAEAAGLQGKYWEMHDKIYLAQSNWSELSGSSRTNYFADAAKQLGLDLTKFNADLAGTTNSTSINMKIDFDYALGKQAGVDSTPSFFLNGTKLEATTWSDSAKLKTAINDALNTAGIALPNTAN